MYHIYIFCTFQPFSPIATETSLVTAENPPPSRLHQGHLNGITQRAMFGVGFLLGVIGDVLRLLHVISESCLFIAEQSRDTDGPQGVEPSATEGHLHHFRLDALTDAVVETQVCRFLSEHKFSLLSDECPGVHLLRPTLAESLVFMRESQTGFPIHIVTSSAAV